MKELEKQLYAFLENNKNYNDYYYNGILWEIFWEYEYRYNNYEDYKETIPKELLTFEDLQEIADYICGNEYINTTLHEIMCDRFETYKKGD